MALPRPQIAAEGALAQPLRLLASRGASGFAGGLMLLIGAVLLVTALVTVVWQDPFTAVFAQQDQKALSKELAATEKAPLPASTLALVERAETDPERMAVLAKHLGGRAESGKPLGRISISKIDASFVFVSGTGNKSLKRGPGHYARSVLPGQRGTVAIAGHRTTYSAPFRHLDRLRRGDNITLAMPYGRFAYDVEGSRVVAPTRTSVLRHVRHDRLVLTTCTPLFSAKKRLVVTARLKRATARGPATLYRPTRPAPPRF
jgi:sortase A